MTYQRKVSLMRGVLDLRMRKLSSGKERKGGGRGLETSNSLNANMFLSCIKLDNVIGNPILEGFHPFKDKVKAWICKNDMFSRNMSGWVKLGF